MKCEVCGNEVRVSSGVECTNAYEPENKKLVDIADMYEIPFKCPLCGCLHFNVLKPTRDVVFLWLIAEKVATYKGVIHLPDDDYVGGNTQKKFARGTAVVLSSGKKRYNEKKKYIGEQDDVHVGDVVFYNKNIPDGWRYEFEFGGKDVFIVYCGVKDILAIEESIDERFTTEKGRT
jgi:co-chaperonin GroES (HSP10)